jgi:diaminopimelate epimerase
VTIVRAHAYGNDFLLLPASLVPAGADRPALARALCDRHSGLGGDGLILHQDGEMSLLNADGSYSEVSGNGVRCLAAWLAEERRLAPGGDVDVRTDAGVKRLRLLAADGPTWTFRAAMGEPEAIARVTLDVDGQPTEVVTLRVGNPQCVVLGPVTHERLLRLASRLAVHPHFSHGTNVELATIEAPGRVRILIWERGVGPTRASGTGACAAAVAAMAFGGAPRDVEVVSPGGTQRVEWREDGLHLTGTAEIIATCEWRGRMPVHA